MATNAAAPMILRISISPLDTKPPRFTEPVSGSLRSCQIERSWPLSGRICALPQFDNLLWRQPDRRGRRLGCRLRMFRHGRQYRRAAHQALERTRKPRPYILVLGAARRAVSWWTTRAGSDHSPSSHEPLLVRPASRLPRRGFGRLKQRPNASQRGMYFFAFTDRIGRRLQWARRHHQIGPPRQLQPQTMDPASWAATSTRSSARAAQRPDELEGLPRGFCGIDSFPLRGGTDGPYRES
jgi:hypothetical protein